MWALRAGRYTFASGKCCLTKTTGRVNRKTNFSLLRYYATVKLNLQPGNIVRSSFPDVTGFENVYIHDLVWENLDKWPEKVALECAITGKSYTYKELRKVCGRLATSFRRIGILPGETVAVVLPNVPEFAVLVLAANEAGVVATLVNPSFQAEEIRKQLKLSDAVAVVTVSSKYETIKKSIDENPNIRLPIIVVNDGSEPLPSGSINFNDLVKEDIEEFSRREKISRDYEDAVILPFSSGTTGFPKGVEINHRSLVANVLQTASKDVTVSEEATSYFQEVIPLVLPLFHVYGLVVTFYHGLRLGAKMIFLPKFTLPDFVNLLKVHKPSILHLVPPIIQMMAHRPEVKKEYMQSLKYILSGAAPLGKELIALFQEKLHPNTHLGQGYGLSEASPLITVSKGAPIESVGYLIPNTEIRVVGCSEENKGRNLGIGEVGELYVKGPQIMKGYYKNPQATAEAMDGEWLKTGDLASYSEDASIYVQERLKELIKVKGFQVAPAELEELIRGHEKVEDVAVIGISNKESGEVPKAFVVPKKGSSVSKEDVKQYVAQRVAKYKQLGEVEFVNSIPKSASGKILRRELRKLNA